MAEIQLATFSIDFEANCLASDTVEGLVFITGPPVGNVLQVTTVDIDDGAKMPAIGIIISKSSATVCLVRVQGEFNLAAPGFTAGDSVFASVNGTLTTTPPARPSSGSRFLQRIGIALSDVKLVINPAPFVHEIFP